MEFLQSAWTLFTDNWQVFLRGAYTALLLAIIGTIIGALIGFFIGIMHTIPQRTKSAKTFLLKIFNFILTAYVEIFRGTPMMVQAMIIFYIMPVLISTMFNIDIDIVNNILSIELAAFITVTLNTTAYLTEVLRGGIMAVDKGQKEAAEALGLSKVQTMTVIVFPQAIKNIITISK